MVGPRDTACARLRMAGSAPHISGGFEPNSDNSREVDNNMYNVVVYQQVVLVQKSSHKCSGIKSVG